MLLAAAAEFFAFSLYYTIVCCFAFSLLMLMLYFSMNIAIITTPILRYALYAACLRYAHASAIALYCLMSCLLHTIMSLLAADDACLYDDAYATFVDAGAVVDIATRRIMFSLALPYAFVNISNAPC